MQGSRRKEKLHQILPKETLQKKLLQEQERLQETRRVEQNSSYRQIQQNPRRFTLVHTQNRFPESFVKKKVM